MQRCFNGPSPHVFDVQAAGCHIRGHQHGVLIGPESVERLEPLPLLHACGKHARWEATSLKGPGQLVGLHAS